MKTRIFVLSLALLCRLSSASAEDPSCDELSDVDLFMRNPEVIGLTVAFGLGIGHFRCGALREGLSFCLIELLSGGFAAGASFLFTYNAYIYGPYSFVGDEYAKDQLLESEKSFLPVIWASAIVFFFARIIEIADIGRALRRGFKDQPKDPSDGPALEPVVELGTCAPDGEAVALGLRYSY